MTDRDEKRAAKALQGVEFPADRAALLEYARAREVDAKSMQALRSLPDRRYASMPDVTDAVAKEPEGSDTPGGEARHSG